MLGTLLLDKEAENIDLTPLDTAEEGVAPLGTVPSPCILVDVLESLLRDTRGVANLVFISITRSISRSVISEKHSAISIKSLLKPTPSFFHSPCLDWGSTSSLPS